MPVGKIFGCVITLLLVLPFEVTWAQRSLVDVPSSEIVEFKKLYLQEQAVFNRSGINTSTVATYGLGKNFEIGITLYELMFQRSQGIEVDAEKPDENPDFLVNAQKGFTATDWLTVNIGTRAGMSAAKRDQKSDFVNFDFLNNRFTIAHHHLIAGVYYANDAYTAGGTNVGLIAGADVSLIKDKLNLIGDFFSGTTSFSVFNAAFEVSLPKEWKITIGAQFPAPGSDNENGAVLQVSKN
jgi:hypothetical protein